MGFELITPNRILSQPARKLAGKGVELIMSVNLQKMLDRSHEIFGIWYYIYIDHIHLLNLTPKKWLQSDEAPVVGDLVLFVVNDALAAVKKDADWKIGLIVKVLPRRVVVEHALKSRTN